MEECVSFACDSSAASFRSRPFERGLFIPDRRKYIEGYMKLLDKNIL
jgi:hypothetical protein